MARSVLFLMLIVVANVALALLYAFSFLSLPLVAFFWFLLAAFTTYLLMHPRSQWLVANRSRLASSDCVALTFDDGPDPVDTPRLLDLLQALDVKATFFVVGKRAEQYPEIVRRAWQEGHLIANHTWSHRLLFCFLTPRRLAQEVEWGAQSVQRHCGIRPRYFRSPVGLRHPLLGISLQKAQLEFISWQVRSYDTIIKRPAVLKRRILKKTVGGDIILLHDHLPSGTDVMLQALPDIVAGLRQRGMKFALVGSRGDLDIAVPRPIQIKKYS